MYEISDKYDVTDLKKPEIETLLTEIIGLAFGLLMANAEQQHWLLRTLINSISDFMCGVARYVQGEQQICDRCNEVQVDQR
ncbi:hypothetical protein BDV96DRAFT_590108 [Lophiotrema nucula]|uniref:Uncharacterized protein n=1 Tax=Lophiotrema nucula TaxID=690887 RepID=A0A6A5YIQ1_9PLEO|nr:hypothetical protein BDV96DRAFT_590108 [Lophiotrema nucula]